MKKKTVLAAVALAAACGFADVTRPPRIVAFGDSITEGVIGVRPEENWLRLLQAKLGDRAVTFNAGVGGNSAREAMARFEKDVLSHDPDVVLIEFGGNNHDPNRPDRHVKDDEFRAHLETFRARLPIGCRVVAVTFPPIKDDWHAYGHHVNFPNGLDAAMEPQRAILRDFARENDWAVLDLYELLKPMRDEVLLKDGVHLNPKGQRVFAEAAEKTLEENGLLEPVVILTGPEAWGGRPAHPAVVNPVTGQDPANVLSLRGEWEFKTSNNFGRNQPWSRYKWVEDPNPWPFRIQVPSCWEAQGVGGPGEGKCWNVLGDNNQKPIRHQYMGVGCYRKRVKIPESWRGKRIWLKVGGAKSVGWFYVNEKAVACVDIFCGTYKYDITDLVTPGKEALVWAQVRNDVPSRTGLFSAMHRWGGLYRDVELEATPEAAYIDDAWVRGDFDRQEAEAHVEVGLRGLRELRGLRGGEGLEVRFGVEGQMVTVPVGKSSEVVLRQKLDNFRPWSPEHPNLYTGVVELVRNGQVIHVRRERFGIRKLEMRGKEFYLNDKPFYFRAYGDDHVYPITGLTPADVNVHRKHLALACAAGFNALRFHTHIEVPEYLEAADELGILIEAEMPYYNDEPTEGQVFDPIRDVTELWRHFRRYPSFSVYSMGNEGTFGDRLDREMHRYVKAMDPDRLKINQDCHVGWINAADRSDYAGGPITIWKRGSYDPDRPFVTHEYMNLGAKLDSRLEPRFNGIWQPPVTRKARQDWLAKFGLDLDWGDRLQYASHRLQRVYQKRGIECARTDPYCDGFCFWTIVDVVVANLGTYSAQGLFNPFWETKEGGYAPADIAKFNSPAGVFLDTDPVDRIYTSGQAFRGEVRFANYGDGPFKAARLDWTIDAEGKTLASGSQDVGDLALGAVRPIATLALTAPEVAHSLKAVLRLSLLAASQSNNRTIEQANNSYDLWLFPNRTVADGSKIAAADEYRARLKGRYANLLPMARAAEADVVIVPYGSQAAADALARGQKVITLRGMDGKANVSLGWWWFGSQVGTAFAKHPALGALPHEGYLSPLLFRVLKQGLPLPYKGLDRRDMIAVGEGGDACYVYLAQAKSGKGKVLMDFGLDVLSDTPEGTSVLDGLVAYARSSEFAPLSEVKLPVYEPGNGWAKTVRAGESVKEPMPFGRVRLDVARGLKGMNELVWETRPAPADVRKKATCDFRFYGGQGYLAQPPTSFELFVNGVKAIDIPEVTLKDRTWTGNGCTLKYVRDKETMENGWYTLTVPSDRLTPGRPVTLRVVAKVNDTRRWFAVVAE